MEGEDPIAILPKSEPLVILGSERLADCSLREEAWCSTPPPELGIMGMCASKPAHKEEAERHSEGALTPGATATATISPSVLGAKSTEQETVHETSGELPIAKDSYGAEEVQKPRSARTSLDARSSPAEPTQDGLSSEDATGVSTSDVDDPQLMKEYIRLAEMLRYSPYPVTLIAIEEDNQPYVFVNNVSSLCSAHRVMVHSRTCHSSSFNSTITTEQFLQVFCEKLGFIDTDVIGKSWYVPLNTTVQPATSCISYLQVLGCFLRFSMFMRLTSYHHEALPCHTL